MKIAYLTGIRRVELDDGPEPKLQRPDDVLINVITVGVCGSDMHYYRTGRIGDMVVEYPFAVGHEFCGEVLEVGPEVDRVRRGDRVAVDPLIPCGRCDQCTAGREHTCRDQVFLGCPGQMQGCLAERIVMPQRCCYPVPETLTSEQAALIEPFSIGLYAQRLAGDMAGKSVAILGVGPIGLCVLLAARAAGAERVFVTDIRDNRARLAAECGADWAGNPEKQDVVAEILRRQPEGVDFAYECAGEQETLDQAVGVLTPGGKVLIVGIPEFERFSFRADVTRRNELSIQSVRRQNRCVQPAIDMVAKGKVHLDALVTHRFPLERTQEALDLVADYRLSLIHI